MQSAPLLATVLIVRATVNEPGVPCRVGTVQIYRLLSRIRDGLATASDLQLLETLCDMVKSTSLCGLGQTAPNPVLSTLR